MVPAAGDTRAAGTIRRSGRRTCRAWLPPAGQVRVLNFSGQAGFGAKGGAGRLALRTVIGRVQLRVRGWCRTGAPVRLGVEQVTELMHALGLRPRPAALVPRGAV